jgi:NNP family nitrate/nitrite transporter-like MFS transporter
MVEKMGGRVIFLALLCMAIVGMIGLLVLLSQLDELSANMQSCYLYAMLLGLGVSVGCGTAAFSVGIGQISYWYPQHEHGKVNGIYAGVGNLAPGAMATALPFVLEARGLLFAYELWFALLVIGTMTYVILGTDAWYFQLRSQGASAEQARSAASRLYEQTFFPRGGAIEGLGVAASCWKTWMLVLVYFATFGGFVALNGWFPTYWKSFHGVAETTAGIFTGIFSMGSCLVRTLSGPVADKIGGEVTLMTATGFMCIGASILLATTAESVKMAFVGEIFLALGMGISNAAVFKLVPCIVPHALGGVAGWVGGLGAFGGFAIPPMMGACVATYGSAGYSFSFSIFVALSLMAFFLALLLKLSPAGLHSHIADA